MFARDLLPRGRARLLESIPGQYQDMTRARVGIFLHQGSVMTAEEWNASYPIGTEILLTLNNGVQKAARTVGAAVRYGGIDHIQVDALTGYVLLAWVKPVVRPTSA